MPNEVEGKVNLSEGGWKCLGREIREVLGKRHCDLLRMRRRAATPHFLVLLIARHFGTFAAESDTAQCGLRMTRLFTYSLQWCQLCRLASIPELGIGHKASTWCFRS